MEGQSEERQKLYIHTYIRRLLGKSAVAFDLSARVAVPLAQKTAVSPGFGSTLTLSRSQLSICGPFVRT